MTTQSRPDSSKPASRRGKAKAKPDTAAAGTLDVHSTNAAGRPTRLDLIVSLIGRPDGASLAELTDATGWQVHSVRGALAGSLKKKGHRIVSEKADPDKSGGPRRYRIEASGQ
jgi:hypothetical protein